MFGYIRPVRAELLVKEAEFYDAVYCGLCRYSGKTISRFSRLLLNYDFTALALLRISLGGETPTVRPMRCPYGLRKKSAVICDEAYGYVCAAFGLFAYYKWKDDLHDEPAGISRFGKRLLTPLFVRLRKKALRLGIDETLVTAPLDRLRALEEANCASPDEAADTFGTLMKGVAAYGLSGDRKAIAEQCGYHIGRFVYLIDAYDDLRSDEKTGNYNPFLARYGSAEEALAHEDDITQTLEDSMRVFSRSYVLACPAVPTGIDRILLNISDLGGKDAIRRVGTNHASSSRREKGNPQNV